MTSFPQETYFKQWQTWKAKRCLEKCKTGLPKRGQLDRHRVFLLLHSSPVCVFPCLPDNAVSQLCVWKLSEEFEFQAWKRWYPFTPHSTFSVRIPLPGSGLSPHPHTTSHWLSTLGKFRCLLAATTSTTQTWFESTHFSSIQNWIVLSSQTSAPSRSAQIH